jgi:hypothetical protein
MADLSQRLIELRANDEWEWETIPDFDFTFWPSFSYWECSISIYGNTQSVNGRGETPLAALEDAAKKMPDSSGEDV